MTRARSPSARHRQNAPAEDSEQLEHRTLHEAVAKSHLGADTEGDYWFLPEQYRPPEGSCKGGAS